MCKSGKVISFLCVCYYYLSYNNNMWHGFADSSIFFLSSFNQHTTIAIWFTYVMLLRKEECTAAVK